MPRSVKTIIPPRFQEAAIYRVLEQELAKFGPFLVSDFEKLVKDWKGDKPKFVKAVIIRKDQLVLQVRVTGSELAKNKFVWIDEGTRPHTIRPKNAKKLHFQTGGKAGSKPGTTFTTAATPPDGADVYANEVHHPGTEARGWTEIIIKQNQKDFQEWMKAAMQTAAYASGHAAKK